MLNRALDRIVREESGRVMAALIGALGDFELAEDAFQDAVQAALEHWPRDGLPRAPGAWLTTTARRKAIDRTRRSAVARAKAPAFRDELLVEREGEGRPDEGDPWNEPLPDERLRLVFTCCHPALSMEARVALTLRTLGGLTTGEIARAFLVPEATMAQRLVRAKRKIKGARIPYRVPTGHELRERLDGVLAVIYLVFNEGYFASSTGPLIRRDLTAEALRLARILAQLLPDEPEALGLLALMLFHDSRAAARTTDGGQLVPLDEQDRSLWDQEEITRASALTERALRMKSVGPYQLQAAIAGVHAASSRAADTDWVEIALLYDLLYRTDPTDMVALNRVVAWANVKGPQVGLERLEARWIESMPEAYHLTRADFLRRLERWHEADAAYAAAAAVTDRDHVLDFIARRRASLQT